MLTFCPLVVGKIVSLFTMSFLKRVTLLLIVAVASLPALAGASPIAPSPTSGLVEVVVTLDAKPLARGGDLRTLEVAQRSVESELADRIQGLTVKRRFSTVVDGLAVTLPASELSALEGTDGVVRVYPNVAYRALRSSSPGFIGAPALWGPTLRSAGNGVKIGIIDDGLDKTHPYFRARGYRMPRGFPKGQKAYTSAKVIVARAFAPRTPAWKYGRRPFDPINSDHATHVAGIAAGNHRTQAQGGRISGVAPKAYLGNYKVLTVPTRGFGLNGNSAEIVAGIEAAVRDGMDVINLSLGEVEVEPNRDIVARALDGAAAAGVVPVVAAGNSFEELGAGSIASPGSSDRAITVAAESEEGGAFIASFSSGGPTPLSLRMKPDVTAPGESVLSSVPRREGLWASFSGTSMASPHVAGAAALLHQRHPSWTVEQIKSALVQTGRPVLLGGAEVESTREGGGTVDLVRADRPLLFASPTGLSFGHVLPGATVASRVTLTDAGGGTGPWAVSTSLQQLAGGVTVSALPTVTVPGELVVTATAAPGSVQGTRTGFVELTRGTDHRRIPYWLRVSAPGLAAAQTTSLARTGTYKGDTRGRAALVESYRYPEDPRGFGVPRFLPGPEHVFRVTLRRRVANFGVAVTGGRLDVQPRVVRAGDENRLLGEIALPYNANPYLSGFGRPVPVVGAALPAPGDYDIVFDTLGASRAGPFTFRFWIRDMTPPRLKLLSARGGVVRVLANDTGAGINPGSIRLFVDGRRHSARYDARRRAIVTTGRKVARGRHLLRLVVSDYQELKNMENVRRILPNTARLRATLVVR
jgi:subtilisin family serine protease